MKLLVWLMVEVMLPKKQRRSLQGSAAHLCKGGELMLWLKLHCLWPMTSW